MNINWQVVSISITALIALLGLYVQIRNSNKIRESSESDAYKEAKELILHIKELKSFMGFFSTTALNGFDVSIYFPDKKNYHNNQEIKNKIRNKMTQTEEYVNQITFVRFEISKGVERLEELGKFTSKRNKELVNDLIEKTMHLEGYVRSYYTTVFDYFDDDEYCKGMRYSMHIINGDAEELLLSSLQKNQEKIYYLVNDFNSILEKIDLKVTTFCK